MGDTSGAVLQRLEQTLERRRAIPLWHPVQMEWHWGNIGSFLAGLSTVAIAVAALRQGPAAVRAWIDRQRAQAEASREEAQTIRLERQRYLSGWSGHGIDTFGVTLVADDDEREQAARSLAGGHPSPYVILRVSEGGQGDLNRAWSLRQIIEREGYISRPPTTGEREALEKGLDAMGIPRAGYGQIHPPQLPDEQKQQG
jgi:hypothetical protein